MFPRIDPLCMVPFTQHSMLRLFYGGVDLTNGKQKDIIFFVILHGRQVL